MIGPTTKILASFNVNILAVFIISVGPLGLLPIYFHLEVIYFTIKRKAWVVRKILDFSPVNWLYYVGLAKVFMSLYPGNKSGTQ